MSNCTPWYTYHARHDSRKLGRVVRAFVSRKRRRVGFDRVNGFYSRKSKASSFSVVLLESKKRRGLMAWHGVVRVADENTHDFDAMLDKLRRTGWPMFLLVRMNSQAVEQFDRIAKKHRGRCFKIFDVEYLMAFNGLYAKIEVSKEQDYAFRYRIIAREV